MPDRQPIGDRLAWSETEMPDQTPTQMPKEDHRRPTFLIEDPPVK